MNIVGYHISHNLIATHQGNLRREKPWLSFLMEGQDLIRIFYHLDYSVACLLRMIECTESELRILNDTGQLKKQGYKFKYIPKKFFSIAHGDKFAVYTDASQYMDRSELKERDGESSEALATRNAYLAYEIGVAVYQALTKLGLHPKSLTSPVSVFANEKLSIMNLPTIYDMPEEAVEYAIGCCVGPWVEAFQKGHFKETWDYDLSSAYPYQLSQLADIRLGNWIKTDKYELDAYYGYAYGMVTVTSDFSPIIYPKSNEQSFTPKGSWERYCTKEQIDFLYWYKRGTFQVYSGWWWYPEKLVYPLKGIMVWLYSKKREARGLDKTVIKRIMAGIWGRTLQITQKGEPGDFFNPCWGAEVESRTALEVAAFIIENKLEDSLLSIAVDGVLSSKEDLICQ